MSHYKRFGLIGVVTVTLLVGSAAAGHAQELKPHARKGFLAGDTIQLIVLDGRRITDDFGKVPQFFSLVLHDAYPDAVIILGADSLFYTPARAGAITVRVQVLGYNKGFGIEAGAGIGAVGGTVIPLVLPQGKWNGATALAITTFDKRIGRDSKQITTISKVVSKANTWGSRSGTQAMHESLSEAANALLNYLDTLFSS